MLFGEKVSQRGMGSKGNSRKKNQLKRGWVRVSSPWPRRAPRSAGQTASQRCAPGRRQALGSTGDRTPQPENDQRTHAHLKPYQLRRITFCAFFFPF